MYVIRLHVRSHACKHTHVCTCIYVLLVIIKYYSRVKGFFRNHFRFICVDKVVEEKRGNSVGIAVIDRVINLCLMLFCVSHMTAFTLYVLTLFERVELYYFFLQECKKIFSFHIVKITDISLKLFSRWPLRLFEEKHWSKNVVSEVRHKNTYFPNERLS